MNTTISIQSHNIVITDYIIYNIQGAEIAKSTVDETNLINLDYLESGVYFIRLNNANNYNALLKFIKQ